MKMKMKRFLASVLSLITMFSVFSVAGVTANAESSVLPDTLENLTHRYTVNGCNKNRQHSKHAVCYEIDNGEYKFLTYYKDGPFAGFATLNIKDHPELAEIQLGDYVDGAGDNYGEVCYYANFRKMDDVGKCGENVTSSYDSRTKTYTINCTGEGAGKIWSFASFEYSTFSLCRGDIENLVIGEGVEEIGMNAFKGCETLKTVTFADSVTKIGSGCFEDCPALTEINFGKNLEDIGERTFANCDSLENVTFPENLVDLRDEAFADCDNLKNVKFETPITFVGENAFYLENSTEATAINLTAYTYFMGKPHENGLIKYAGRYFNYEEIFKIETDMHKLTYFFKITDCEEDTDVHYFVVGDAGDGKKYLQRFEHNGLTNSRTSAPCEAEIGQIVEPTKYFGKYEVCPNAKLEAIKDKTECGPDAHYTYDADTKTLSITGTGHIYNAASLGTMPIWHRINPYGISYRTDIENVVIGEGITEIMEGAFGQHDSLKTVQFPSTLQTLGRNVFYATALEVIDLPEDVQCTERTFGRCSNLKTVYVTGRETYFYKTTFDGVGSKESPVTMVAPAYFLPEIADDQVFTAFGGTFRMSRVEADADYTRVYAAIDKAQTYDPDLYVNYDKVQEIIDNIFYYYTADEQDCVDAYETAIYEALDNLVLVTDEIYSYYGNITQDGNTITLNGFLNTDQVGIAIKGKYCGSDIVINKVGTPITQLSEKKNYRYTLKAKNCSFAPTGEFDEAATVTTTMTINGKEYNLVINLTNHLVSKENIRTMFTSKVEVDNETRTITLYSKKNISTVVLYNTTLGYDFEVETEGFDNINLETTYRYYFTKGKTSTIKTTVYANDLPYTLIVKFTGDIFNTTKAQVSNGTILCANNLYFFQIQSNKTSLKVSKHLTDGGDFQIIADDYDFIKYSTTTETYTISENGVGQSFTFYVNGEACTGFVFKY